MVLVLFLWTVTSSSSTGGGGTSLTTSTSSSLLFPSNRWRNDRCIVGIPASPMGCTCTVWNRSRCCHVISKSNSSPIVLLDNERSQHVQP